MSNNKTVDLEKIERMKKTLGINSDVGQQIHRICKVKIADLMVIDYIIKDEGDDSITTKEIKLSSGDKPLGAFIDAANSFISQVIEYVGLDSGKWDDIKITGINIKEESRGIGLVISATGEINGLPVNINTPYLNPEIVEESFELQENLDELTRQAILYINGERQIKQIELL